MSVSLGNPLQATPPTSVDTTPMSLRKPGASAAERAMELDRERARWAAGYEGERRVGAALDQLPARDWFALHDLPRGPNGTNLDHLVIGVGGVFTINAKNVSGDVWVAERTLKIGNSKSNLLPVAASEARDVQRRLSGAIPAHLRVRPLIVFVKAAKIAAMPSDVTILSVAELVEWFMALPHVLPASDIERIFRLADRPEVWQ
jgi:hypothetical protein